MEFTSRSIALFTSGLLNLLLAGFVFWQYRKRRIARIFSFTTFLIAAYSWLVAGLAAAKSLENALLWLRIFMPLVYFQQVAMFHFSMIFSRTENRFTRGMLYSAYSIAAILAVLKIFYLTPAGAEYRGDQGWFPANDPVYFFVYAYFVLLLLISGIILVIRRLVKNRSTTERNQMWFYIIAGGGAVILSYANLVPSIAFLAAFSRLSIQAFFHLPLPGIAFLI